MSHKQSDESPIVIQTRGARAGICMEYVAEGHLATIETCGFHAFDEGLMFYNILESFNEYVQAAKLSPSMVDHMLVVISPTETQIYANEKLPYGAMVRVKGRLHAGQPVYKDSIAGCTKLDFPDGIDLPPNSGFMLLISVGWRRGVCFDLRPLAPTSANKVSTEEAFEQLKVYGGMLLSHLLFTERFLLTPDDWEQLIASGWFPFLLIPDREWERLVSAIRAGASLDTHEGKIHSAFLQAVDTRLEEWCASPHFECDNNFLRDAVDLYKLGKWAPCVSLLLPRIEGLLCRAFGIPETIKSKDFLAKLEEDLKQRETSRSLLFPKRFVQFMKNAIYPYTDFANPQLPATRHTIGHGRVEYEAVNSRKLALTTCLLIDNLLYCMPKNNPAVSEKT